MENKHIENSCRKGDRWCREGSQIGLFCDECVFLCFVVHVCVVNRLLWGNLVVWMKEGENCGAMAYRML